MKKTKALFIIILFGLIYILFLKLNLKWDCIFKSTLHFACPGCGLTRSLKALLSFDFIASVKYNILGIPIFILGVITIFIAVKDFIKNEDTVMPLVYKKLKKNCNIIFIILLITMIINNINGV